MTARQPSRRCRGVTRGDVIVMVLLVTATAMLVLMGLTRTREGARLSRCTLNLSRIGFALSQYDQMHGHLPQIGRPAPPGAEPDDGPPGPLKILLEALDLPDLTELKDPKTRPKSRTGPVPGEVPVPGFTCTSDPNATSGVLRAPISYRAATGGGPRGVERRLRPGANLEPRDDRGPRRPRLHVVVQRAPGRRRGPARGAARVPDRARPPARLRLPRICRAAIRRPDPHGSRPAIARPSTTTPCRPTPAPPASPTAADRPSWAPRAGTSAASTSCGSMARSRSPSPRSLRRSARDLAAITVIEE